MEAKRNVSIADVRSSSSEDEEYFSSDVVEPPLSDKESSDESETDESSTSYDSETTWPDIEIPGSWGTYGFDENPWDDDLKPVVRLRNYEDLELTEEELDGILTERIMACCSSYLNRSPEIGKYVLCKVNLCSKNLQDISIMTFHHYLQYVNLSENRLTDLRPLGEMPFLMYLDVSRNNLTEVLNFKPPFKLTYVNYSHNDVDVIDDLSGFWSLVYLDLSHNKIYYIKGLQNLHYLRFLNLSHNQLRDVRGLNNMRLHELILSDNKLQTVVTEQNSGLHTLKDLVKIDLSNNNFTSLKMFQNVEGIQKITMSRNKISHPIEFEHLKHLRFLTEVDFRENPMCFQPRYFATGVELIKPLLTFDDNYVTSEDKVLARCAHEPPVEIEAARRRANLLVLEKLMKYEVNESTLPISKPVPPMMVLVSPYGCGQKALLIEFAERYEKYVKLGACHTTRPPMNTEIEGVHGWFVTDAQFKEMMKDGQFLAVSDCMGHLYGFHRDELLKVCNKKRVLVFSTDLIIASTLRMKSLRPTLILSICCEEKQYEILVETLCYTQWAQPFKSDGIKLNPHSEIYLLITKEIRTDDGDDQDFTNAISELQEELLTHMPSLAQNPIPPKSDVIIQSLSIQNPESQKSEKSGEVPETREQYFRSISEHDFDRDTPILSILSEYLIKSSSESSSVSGFLLDEEVQKFINTLIDMRKQYVAFHLDNPGFFSDVITIEKHDDSMAKLKTILKELVLKKKLPVYDYSYKDDPCFEEMITERLNILYTEMYNEMTVSEDQQPKCWKTYVIDNLDP